MTVTTSPAQLLPKECILTILDYLWEDAQLNRFYDRRRQKFKDYDQTLVHQTLRIRSISPLHVCHNWRSSCISRYFRHTLLNMTAPQRAPLPHTAVPHIERLYVILRQHCIAGSSLPFSLPRVHSLGICVLDSSRRGHRDAEVTFTEDLPQLQRVWFQSLGRVSAEAKDMLAGLRQRGAMVCAVHLCFSGQQDVHAVGIVHDSCEGLESLCLGRISGATLSDLMYISAESKHVKYPRLHRLVFSVDIHAHIYSRTPTLPSSFPSLQELYYDDSHGVPREEWHAPLFDTLIKYSGHELRYLAFPIVYNTQRTVSSTNCPRLVELRHIKCCWATGAWSSEQIDSDSTRVLRAIGSIATLKKYVHPSYIARLSAIPDVMECRGLRYLNLFGWPLTVADLAWVVQTFSELTVLRVTLTERTDAEQYDRMVELCGNGGGMLKSVKVGLADGSQLSAQDMEHLADFMCQLQRGCQVALFGMAYAHIAAAVAADEAHVLQSIKMTNMDLSNSRESGGSSITSSGAHTPANWWPMATANGRANAETRLSMNNSWHLVQQLLIGE
ncbi:hypothetical protein GGF37_003567 [Kickxella alabastrina]|nr:hypothetical protein GGF37_003567 [Kickxella alabastrina]